MISTVISNVSMLVDEINKVSECWESLTLCFQVVGKSSEFVLEMFG